MTAILKNLKVKVTIPVLILLGVLGAIAWSSVNYLSRMQSLNDKLTGRFHEIERVRHMELEVMAIMHALLSAGQGATGGIEAHSHEKPTTARDQIRANLTRLQELAGDLGEMEAEVIVSSEREVLLYINDKINAAAEDLERLFVAGDQQVSRAGSHAVIHHSLDPLAERLASWHDQELAQVDGINRESEVVIGSFKSGLVLYSIIAMLTLAFAMVYYHVSLTRRIVSIRNGTQALTRGDFSFKIDVEGADELNTVAADINRMASDLETYRNKLAALARTDELTGLANRRALDEILYKELARARRRGRNVAVMMIDLDHFKNINDTWGHEVGDQALIHTAVWLESEVRHDELVFRLGGEEFVVFLPEVESGDALVAAERIRKRIENSSFMTDGHEIRFTASIGIVEAGKTEYEMRKLLNYADRALYAAKREGRNRCVVYDSI